MNSSPSHTHTPTHTPQHLMECIHPSWKPLELAPLPACCPDPNAHFEAECLACWHRLDWSRGYIIKAEWRQNNKGPDAFELFEWVDGAGTMVLEPIYSYRPIIRPLGQPDRDSLTMWQLGDLAVKFVKQLGHWPPEWRACGRSWWLLSRQTGDLRWRLVNSAESRLSQPGRRAWMRQAEEYAATLLSNRRLQDMASTGLHDEAFLAVWRQATTERMQVAPLIGDDDSLAVDPEGVSPEWQPWPGCTLSNASLIGAWVAKCSFPCLVALHFCRHV